MPPITSPPFPLSTHEDSLDVLLGPRPIVKLPAHYELERPLNGFPIGILGAHEAQDGPCRLNDLAHRVRAVDARDA